MLVSLIGHQLPRTETELLKALDNEPWPLPNLKPSTEKAFWDWRQVWSFKAEVYYSSRQVKGEWARVLVYWADVNECLSGGFAVFVFDKRVEYHRWGLCDHEFSHENIGRCLHRYTCNRCSQSFELDTSD
jgi:hypothetical protein